MYEIIKNLCAKNKTTVTALCEKVTGSKGNLATWKKGNIRPDYLLKIADYFNVSTDYLLGNESKKISPPQFSDEDIETIEMFKALDEDKQRLVLEMMRNLKK